MTKLETEIQYNWAVERVEKLLLLVDETTPETHKNNIELICFLTWLPIILKLILLLENRNCRMFYSFICTNWD